MPGKLAAGAACFFNITRQQLQADLPRWLCRLSMPRFCNRRARAAFSIYGFINHGTQYFSHGEGERRRGAHASSLIEISQSTLNEKRSNWQQLLLIVIT